MDSTSPVVVESNAIPGARLTVRLLAVLVVMCFVIVTLGGWVRLSGSGLAIPQWPFFTVSQTLDEAGKVISEQKSIFPPTTDEGWEILRQIFVREIPGFEEGIALSAFKTMFFIEWGHRAVAKLIGLVYLVFLGVALAYPAVRRRIGVMAVVSLFVLVLQAVLGGIAVLFHLEPVKISLHLVNAFIYTCLLVWMAMRLIHPAAAPEKLNSWNPVFVWSAAVGVLCLVQLFSGGLMAATHAGYTMNTWPKMNDSWVPPGLIDSAHSLWHNFTENVILVQFFHRWFAIVVGLAVFLLAFRSMTCEVSRGARWALRLAPAIVVLQIILGVVTLTTGVHVHVALTHQSIGLVLLLALLVIVYESKNHPVLAEEALAMREEAAVAANAKGAAHA